MTRREDDSIALANMKAGENITINWFEEGGGVVHMLSNYTYILFEVPAYGGEEQFVGCYEKENLGELLDKAFSWT